MKPVFFGQVAKGAASLAHVVDACGLRFLARRAQQLSAALGTPTAFQQIADSPALLGHNQPTIRLA
jgi:hypothetical protein